MAAEDGTSRMPTFTREIIEAAIYGFEALKKSLDDQISELRAMLSGASAKSSSEPTTRRPRRKMSTATRKAMAEGQRKRWAAAQAEAAAAEKAAAKQIKKAKRKLSAEGRAAIVAALKKRWAAKKAK